MQPHDSTNPPHAAYGYQAHPEYHQGFPHHFRGNPYIRSPKASCYNPDKMSIIYRYRPLPGLE